MMQNSETTNFLVQIISTRGEIRSRNLLESLKNQKISYSITEGVIPSYDDYLQMKLHSPKLSKLINFRDIKIGEVGCALAHKKCSKLLIESEKSYGVVLEDDAEIIQNFNFDLLEKYLKAKKPTIVILGWIPGFAVAVKPNATNSDGIFKLVTPTTCTFAYALNKSAANLIINKNSEIIDLADWPIYLFENIEFLITDRAWVTASHDPADSTIGPRSDVSFLNWRNRFLHAIRVIYNLLTMFFYSRYLHLHYSARQIFHRMILKDLIYKYANSQIQKSQRDKAIIQNGIVFAPKKLEMLVKFLKLK